MSARQDYPLLFVIERDTQSGPLLRASCKGALDEIDRLRRMVSIDDWTDMHISRLGALMDETIVDE
jgi:hypothetical protein